MDEELAFEGCAVVNDSQTNRPVNVTDVNGKGSSRESGRTKIFGIAFAECSPMMV